MAGLRELNKLLGRRRRPNTSQAESERNAIEMMELAFSKEKYDDTVARQDKADKRADIRMDWATTEKNVFGIARTASPILETLSDPLDIEEEDMKGIKKSIDAFHAERRYARNEVEKAEYDKIYITLNKTYENALQYQENMTNLSKIRTDYSNLVGEYKDKGGQTRQGEFSVKSTDAILRNSQIGIETSAKMDNEGMTRQFFDENKKAVHASFVARELKYYEDKPMKTKGEMELFNLAKRQVVAEDIPAAYNTLKGLTAAVVSIDGKTTDNYTSNMEKARRLYQKRHNDQVKTASVTSLGVFSQPLKAMANLPDDKANYMNNNDYYTQAYNAFNEVVNSVKNHESKDDPYIWEYPSTRSVFENLPQIGGDIGGMANNLEAMALVLSGQVSDNNGELTYPTGDVYMDAKGDIVNDWGTIYIDEVKWKDKIANNILDLGYGKAGKGSERGTIARSMSLMAKNFLRIALERHPRELKLKSSDSKKTNSQSIINDIANFDSSIDTSKSDIIKLHLANPPDMKAPTKEIVDNDSPPYEFIDPAPLYENEVPWFEDPKNTEIEKEMLSKRAFADLDESLLKRNKSEKWYDSPEMIELGKQLLRGDYPKQKQKYSSKNPRRIKAGPSEEDAIKVLKNFAENIGETRRRQLLASSLRHILTSAEKKKLRTTGKLSKERLSQENVKKILRSLNIASGS